MYCGTWELHGGVNAPGTPSCFCDNEHLGQLWHVATCNDVLSREIERNGVLRIFFFYGLLGDWVARLDLGSAEHRGSGRVRGLCNICKNGGHVYWHRWDM